VNLYFFDTSAIVKRYVAETGTAWVLSLTAPDPGKVLYLANITSVEVVAAVTRRQRGGTLSPADSATALAQFRSDYGNHFFLIEVSPPIVQEAERLAETHALRAYDAVQLAVLLELERRKTSGLPSPILVSADVELNAAATAEGFAVEDPNSHP
jgi:predicted nucleic acid-binding protein